MVILKAYATVIREARTRIATSFAGERGGEMKD